MEAFRESLGRTTLFEGCFGFDSKPEGSNRELKLYYAPIITL